MGFVEAVKTVFSKYATFSGRARRSEYWYFVLLSAIVGVVGGIIMSFSQNIGTIITSVWGLATFIPSLAVVWRRLHDIGKSGVWYFINFVPLAGPIILLIFICKDSQPGSNQYGPNPKGF